MDFSTGITALNQSLNTIKVLAEGLVGVRDLSKLGEFKLDLLQAKIDIAQQVLDMQQEQARLLDRVRELEQQNRRLQDQQIERNNYRLHELRPGFFVFALKPQAQPDDAPVHYLCQPCLDQGVKSVLRIQPETQARYEGYYCAVEPKHSIVATAKPSRGPLEILRG